MVLHHLMVGTWTPPGAIFTFEFDDEKLTLDLIKRTPIPEDKPISWMTFDVSERAGVSVQPSDLADTASTACPEEHLRRRHEEMVELCRPVPDGDRPRSLVPNGA